MLTDSAPIKIAYSATLRTRPILHKHSSPAFDPHPEVLLLDINYHIPASTTGTRPIPARRVALATLVFEPVPALGFYSGQSKGFKAPLNTDPFKSTRHKPPGPGRMLLDAYVRPTSL